jgi:MFS transporter, ACS family, aldohexuronate transporter
MPEHPPLARSHRWKWAVCGLLLLATMINYMDRLTLNLLAVEIKDHFQLSVAEYGLIESGFALGFAFGALLLGWLADRVNVCWVYPAAVFVWSLAGFATGFAWGFLALVLCRTLLGMAESGNWPCALRTTQRILNPEERTAGNSILQSGASIGALLAPGIVLGLTAATGTWRYSFWVVGAFGTLWVILWLAVVKPADLTLPEQPSRPNDPAPVDRPSPLQVRRFLILIVVTVSINTTWHFLRVWLPLFLREEHGYTAEQTAGFLTGYYAATDLGALTAGFTTLFLARRGFSVHASRMLVFLFCALLTSLTVLAALQPASPLLLALLLVIGFGSLGVFPCYYSFSQELTTRHQGKLTGSLSFACWMSMALLHAVVGKQVEVTHSYRPGVALAGLAPLVGFVALAFFWGPTRVNVPVELPSDELPTAGDEAAFRTSSQAIAEKR